MKLKVLFAAVVVLSSFVWPLVARAGSLPTDVVGIFPRDVDAFAFADVQEARSLAWFPQFQKQVLPDQMRQFELFLASPGMDGNSWIEELAWATVPPALPSQPSNGGPLGQETIIVALGQFSPESTAAYFKARKRTVVNVRDHLLYPLNGGSGEGGSFVWFIDSTVAVLGGRKDIERVIRIYDNEEPSLLSNTDLAPLIS